MKERVTLTIEKTILSKIDKTINNSDIKNRSHAIELLLLKALGENRPTQAVILAGGEEPRSRLPRAMIRIQNKPVLEHNILLLKKYGIDNIIICVGEKNELIKEYFGEGNHWGVNITYFEEKEPLGTAGPLYQLRGTINSAFILMNADELKEVDLNDMINFHVSHKVPATLALTTTQDPSKYGVAVLNGHDVTTFIEKPPKDRAPSNLINSGLYILEPSVIKMIPEGFSTLEHDVLPKLASQKKLIGYVFGGQWFDTSTSQKITDAENQWRGIK